MKNKTHAHLRAALAALALGASTSVGLCQATDWLQTFDTDTSTAPWKVWWGTVTITNDATQNATTNIPTSGSMKYVAPFVGAGGEQFMTFAGFHYGWQWDGSTVLDGSKYTNLIFDIKMAPDSSPGVGGGDLGQLTLGFTAPGWPSSGVPMLANYNIPLTATNWTHVVLPINPTTAGIQSINGIYIKMWSNGHLTNTWTAYFDNLLLQAIPTNAAPAAPPTLTLQKTYPGFQLMSTTTGGPNQRQSIHSQTATMGWVGAAAPVTYSITIRDYPDNAHPYYQTHIWLAPASGLPYGAGDVSADWNSTNLIFIQIQNLAGDNAMARFMYKTNVANGGWGGQIFGSNTLAEITSPTKGILGTWSLTFSNDTSVTLTTPSGTSTNFTLPAASAALFAGDVYAFFGMQPNGAGNVGQDMVLSRIQIKGTAPEIDDAFPGPGLDTGTWGVNATDANGLQVVTEDTPFWLLWTLPDSDFTLQSSVSLNPAQASWSDPGLSGSVIQLGPVKRVLVPKTLSWTDELYFRMIKP